VAWGADIGANQVRMLKASLGVRPEPRCCLAASVRAGARAQLALMALSCGAAGRYWGSTAWGVFFSSLTPSPDIRVLSYSGRGRLALALYCHIAHVCWCALTCMAADLSVSRGCDDDSNREWGWCPANVPSCSFPMQRVSVRRCALCTACTLPDLPCSTWVVAACVHCESAMES
jgi:hypothetical protein